MHGYVCVHISIQYHARITPTYVFHGCKKFVYFYTYFLEKKHRV